MTANQINYAKYMEDVRAHMATEDIQRGANAIALRNALANEANAGTNALNASTRVRELEETVRSNMMREIETQRSNMAREAEARRSNQANEAITSYYNQKRIEQGEDSLWQTRHENMIAEQRAHEEERHNRASEKTSVFGTVGNFFGKIAPIVAGLLA
jgi:hypothetical protein